MIIRTATDDDWALIFPFYARVVAEGRTYAFPEGQSEDEARPWWMEQPTSPDDILAHVAIAKAVPVWIATGEHCHSRTMFKQFMQAGAMQVCQLDSCRLGESARTASHTISVPRPIVNIIP